MEEELRRFECTVDALTLRLEHILVALALTFDAQAATRQRLNGNGRDDERFRETVADLQTEAAHYRHLARALTNRHSPSLHATAGRPNGRPLPADEATESAH
jgi:hypothetical protein